MERWKTTKKSIIGTGFFSFVFFYFNGNTFYESNLNARKKWLKFLLNHHTILRGRQKGKGFLILEKGHSLECNEFTSLIMRNSHKHVQNVIFLKYSRRKSYFPALGRAIARDHVTFTLYSHFAWYIHFLNSFWFWRTLKTLNWNNIAHFWHAFFYWQGQIR